MTKTVAYFPLQCALNSGPVMSAAIAGLRRHGFEILANSYDADAAVIWSVLWSGRMSANQQVYNYYRAAKRPVICIEVGALQRGVTWKVALNNVNAQGHYGHRTNLDINRPAKLGISLMNNKLDHGKILVAGQHSRSLQLHDVDQEAWCLDKIKEVAGDRTVVVRPHPRCTLDRTRFPNNVVWETPKKLPDTYDSFDMHWDFDAVINYNSGPGIQAVIQGIPAVVDHSSLAYNVADRQQWLIEICHTEYTVKEIESGTWITRTGLHSQLN